MKEKPNREKYINTFKERFKFIMSLNPNISKEDLFWIVKDELERDFKHLDEVVKRYMEAFSMPPILYRENEEENHLAILNGNKRIREIFEKIYKEIEGE